MINLARKKLLRGSSVNLPTSVSPYESPSASPRRKRYANSAEPHRRGAGVQQNNFLRRLTRAFSSINFLGQSSSHPAAQPVTVILSKSEESIAHLDELVNGGDESPAAFQPRKEVSRSNPVLVEGRTMGRNPATQLRVSVSCREEVSTVEPATIQAPRRCQSQSGSTRALSPQLAPAGSTNLRLLPPPSSSTMTRNTISFPELLTAYSQGTLRRRENLKHSSSYCHSDRRQEQVLQHPALYVTQLTDYLFIASVETLYNEALLCLLSIDLVVDATNVPPDLVPRSRRSTQPCTCPASHVRPKLCVELGADAQETNLDAVFEEVSRFIETARTNHKRVLIASYNGHSRCGVLAVQYLIKFWQMSFRESFRHIKERRPSFLVNHSFRRALSRWEQRQRSCWLERGAEPPFPDRFLLPIAASPKDAWA